MPSTSDKQKRLMAAVANNPKFAKQVGIPQSVGKEFQREDKKMANCPSKKMKKGGMMEKKMGGGMMSGRSQRRRDAMRDEERRMGSMPMMKAGGKLNMVKKGDKMVPDFAADGKGKMAMGGKVMPKMQKGGKVRGCGMARKGVRPAKMV